MQILLVADLHYALRQFDWLVIQAVHFDAVVIAGDLLDISAHVPLDAQIVVVQAYLKRIDAVTRLFVCSGNHDLSATSAAGERVADWFPAGPTATLVTDGGYALLDDLLISVLPWWDGPSTQDQIRAQLARDAQRPYQSWLWVYHAPPADSPVSWSGARHFGDTVLSDWLAQYRPDYVLGGHVHQAPFMPGGSWVDRAGSSWAFNMGQHPGDMPAHIILNTVTREALWFSIYGREHIALHADDARPAEAHPLPGWFTDAGRPAR